MTTTEDSVSHAFRRIIDAAEDALSEVNLEHSVQRSISALNSAQREDLIKLLAGAISRLFARRRVGRSGRNDAQIAARTAGAIVGAARTAGDRSAFDAACKSLTTDLTRLQMARVCAALATEIAETRL